MANGLPTAVNRIASSRGRKRKGKKNPTTIEGT